MCTVDISINKFTHCLILATQSRIFNGFFFVQSLSFTLYLWLVSNKVFIIGVPLPDNSMNDIMNNLKVL